MISIPLDEKENTKSTKLFPPSLNLNNGTAEEEQNGTHEGLNGSLGRREDHSGQERNIAESFQEPSNIEAKRKSRVSPTSIKEPMEAKRN